MDGDGRAELMVRTSDGTRDGVGRVIGDANADYRHRAPADAENPKPEGEWVKYNKQGRPKTGRILTGNEYITVFDGLTGKALATKPYVPARGNLSDWGDNYANRSDRMLAAVGWLPWAIWMASMPRPSSVAVITPVPCWLPGIGTEKN